MTGQQKPVGESAESRLMGASYRPWAADLTGRTWLSPYAGGVLSTAQAIEEFDGLLAQDERPIGLQDAT